MKSSTVAMLTFTMFTACGAQPDLDVGNERAVTGQALVDYAADWDGYGEAFRVEGDGSDRIRVRLDENGVGTVRFGNETVFGPATDPDGAYPPNAVPEGNGVGVQSGFEYPIDNAAVTASRLRFEIYSGALMDSWCSLQEPEPIPGWICGEGGGARAESNGIPECHVTTGSVLTPIDCDVMSQCRYCECDPEACHARAGTPLTFDGALTNDGNSLEGTLLTRDGSRVTVRLER